MREDRFWGQDIVVDKYHAPNANYDMTVRDFVLRPSADPASGPITVELPPVSEARGRLYSIVCRNADAVNTVTITDRNDSECWLADVVFNGKCDGRLFYSDGMCWMHMSLPGSPGVLATTLPPGTTAPPTTLAPTTLATTLAPTTTLTTAAPTTTATTGAPTTSEGTSPAPTTPAPPTSPAPTTVAPTTVAQTTAAPTTPAPTTAAPTTAAPTTLAPTTA